MHGSPETALSKPSYTLPALHPTNSPAPLWAPEIKAVMCSKVTHLSPTYSENGLSPTPWPACPNSNAGFISET